MKAQVINTFGNPSVFEMVDTPLPELKSDYVLVKVHATNVNPIDCKVRSGAVSKIAPEFPAILHGDFSGVVETVGDNVKNFKKGDEVYGCAGGFLGFGGALAEYMLVDVNLIAKKPKILSMKESAALPLVCITSWLALFEKAKLSNNDNVLIHGGVGGVGHIAVQLAKWKGAKVFTTIRKEEDVDLARSLGADEVINVQNETVAQYKKRLTKDKGFDIIFDTVGGQNLDNSYEAAALDGKVVTIAARSTHDLTPMHNKRLTLYCVLMLLPLLNNQGRENNGKILQNIANIVDEGKLKPLIDAHSFNLKDVAKAHELLESGVARGKVVITIASSR